MSTSRGAVIGHELTVADVIEETSDSKSIVLRRPDKYRELFTYRPGQFLTIRIPSDRTGHIARSYSLSSAPDVDDDLKVTVKRTAGGYGSNWLCDNVTPGSLMTVLPPSGRFTPASFTDDLLLFAAGSGITPIISILKTALLRSDCSVVLFYANRDSGSVIFRRELDDYSDKFGDRLTVHYWLDTIHGFPSQEGIAELVADDSSCEVFVCGPAPFMDTVAAGLRAAGVAKERHHQEVFVSISGDPFEAPRPIAGDQSDSVVDTIVHLAGESHQFGWPVGRTLVDVLLDRGVDVPFSCRSGECGSCACTLVSGKVVMENADILDPADIAEGFVLGCQSRPDSGPIEIEF
ncbi:2Fe-2S iron-sulfur cluster-binding protein [Rhodococcus sp. NPDC127528]|uniref:2Fe-2S iron-sulfur cluster-binding protein n=1 Tax=unclassified Rhodococcus (in: high G+C Gram-positive bacteria) TaxID=192944 RepID=UPI00363F1559